MTGKLTEFSLDEAEKRIVDEKLRGLLEVCQIYHLPMFAAVAISNDENNTEYKNITYSGQSHAVYLTNDHIRKHILIADGFEVVPPRDVITFDEEVFTDGD